MLKPPLNDVTSKVEYNRMNQIKIEKLNNFNNLCKEMKYFYEVLKCKHEIFPLFRLATSCRMFLVLLLDFEGQNPHNQRRQSKTNLVQLDWPRPI